MRVQIEVRMRCCGCRAYSFATWLTPEREASPTPAALDAFAAQEVRRFVCKECGGARGVTVAIYSADQVQSKSA